MWVKVAKPTFDLVGVILSSLGFTGILVVLALFLGAVFGLSLILRRRREAMRGTLDGTSLDLGLRPPVA